MTRYANGARFERRVKSLLERQGWVVIRAAGSHGPADLMAAKGGRLSLVQCKVDARLSPAEAEKLRSSARKAGGEAVVAYRSGRGVSFFNVESDG